MQTAMFPMPLYGRLFRWDAPMKGPPMIFDIIYDRFLREFADALGLGQIPADPCPIPPKPFNPIPEVKS